MASKPMVRSLAWCRGRGMIPWIVEKSIPFKGIKIDLFNFGDILAIEPGRAGSLIIQTTTGDHLAERLEKIMDVEKITACAVAWLRAGNRIRLHGWRKIGPRGKRKMWALREIELLLDGENRIIENSLTD